MCGAFALLALAGCGHSDEEMAVMQRRVNELNEEVHTLRLANMPPVYGYGSPDAFERRAHSPPPEASKDSGCTRDP
jgi:hypothetical protein